LWSDRSLPACAEAHGTGSLPNQTRRVGLFGLCRTCSTSDQIDAVTNAPRLLEIEYADGGIHFALQIFDSVGHPVQTRGRAFERHCAPFAVIPGRSRRFQKLSLVAVCSARLGQSYMVNNGRVQGYIEQNADSPVLVPNNFARERLKTRYSNINTRVDRVKTRSGDSAASD